MKFYGRYDTIPLENDSNTYVYQQDFAFLRSDGLMIISPEGTTTDGASCPRFLWSLIGSPLSGSNKEWSSPHDSAYRKAAVIINTLHPDAIDPLMMFVRWRTISSKFFVHQTCKNKKFADDTLLEAMKTCGEPWFKQMLVYRAVRLFGVGWWGEATLGTPDAS